MDYLKRCNGVFLVYSTTDRNSFDALSGYMSLIEEQRPGNPVTIVIVATKTDLTDERVVTKADGQKLARTWDAPFFEVSIHAYDESWAPIQKMIRKIRTCEAEGEASKQASRKCTIM